MTGLQELVGEPHPGWRRCLCGVGAIRRDAVRCGYCGKTPNRGSGNWRARLQLTAVKLIVAYVAHVVEGLLVAAVPRICAEGDD